MTPTPSEIEALLRTVEALPDERARDAARALMAAVLDWHRAGLDRLLGIIANAGVGTDALEALQKDDLIGGLLLLHGLLSADSNAPGVASERSTTATTFVPVERLLRAKREQRQSCGLCGTALPADHRHVLERATQKPECACEGCAILFTNQAGRYRPIPRRVSALTGFRMAEPSWLALGVPVGLAFFSKVSVTNRVVARYPGPAGAVEAEVDARAWTALVAENPVLGELEPDVEALLVNRLEAQSDYYRAPIDECYRLAGFVRSRWYGVSGGERVSAAVAEFFSALRARDYAGAAA
jgi:hypothetical protein